MPSRREFLKIMGSAAVVVAAGTNGGSGCTGNRHTGAAFAPWSEAGSPTYADPRMRALSFAILAPNPHNRQPWQVDLSKQNEVTLYCDPDRLLPETDPFDRQILIGLGCFLEVLRMAAAQSGVVAEVESFPDGVPQERLDSRPIAIIRFEESGVARPDPLFVQVLRRRSMKNAFDTGRPVTSEALAQISGVVSASVSAGYTVDPAEINTLRELSWQAYLVETTTRRTHLESVELYRIGQREIEVNPDGISLDGTFMEIASSIGYLTREKMADPASSVFKQGLDMYEGLLRTGMAYLWINTNGNSRYDQLDAGTAWVRANLKATELGVGLHPLSQCLQEYPEMSGLYRNVHQRLAEPEQRVQMFGRLGYGTAPEASPRWPLETRILSQ